jgi:uncharacterized protein (DUF1800 family)
MASLDPIQGNLGQKRAAHLLRRTSFRYTKNKVNALANLQAFQSIPSLLAYESLKMDQPVYDDSANGLDNVTWILPPGQALPAQDFVLRPLVISWWLNEALNDSGISHKMALFFHQYMIVDAFSYQNTHFFDYLKLMHWGALRNFKDLCTKLVMDNCMIRYLNNQQNTKYNPNENFSREFFELFTIGKGPQAGPGDYTNYTEHDVVEAAKIFTGFRIRGQRDQIDPDTGIPRGYIQTSIHETSDKTFSERFQNTTISGGTTSTEIYQELLDFIDMIFAQEEVSKNFCRRLYRFFVSRKITDEIENDIIEPLAATMRNNNYEIKPVLQQLFMSKHFYDEDDSQTDDDVIGGLIKSPLELMFQPLSFFNLTIPDPYDDNYNHYQRFWRQAMQDRYLLLSGMSIFYPDNVAGYPAYHQSPDFHHQWFNSSTIISRYKMPAILLTGKRSVGTGTNTTIGGPILNSAVWLRDSNFCSDPTDSYVVVQDLLEYLLPLEVDSARFNYFLNTVFLDELPPADWTYEWQDFLNSGDDAEVKKMLDRLLYAILYSPEFQTM